MTANRMIDPTVTSGQSLIIPTHSVNESHETETGVTTLSEELSEHIPWRSITTGPLQTPGDPDQWPIPQQLPLKGEPIAVFKETDINKSIPIYTSRAAYFFMSRMVVEPTKCFSICNQKISPCGDCFKSESTPFYIMPHPISWVSLGDYGVVINTREKTAAYALFADWGPKNESITLNTARTLFSGKIGTGSIYLGKQLKVNPTEPTQYGIVYIIFPNSANGIKTIKSVEEINKEASKAFKRWGGWPQAKYLLKNHYNITM